MIASLQGVLVERHSEGCVVEAGGVGYEVALSPAAVLRLPPTGDHVRVLIVESTALYGGGTTLYGFLTSEEKQVYRLLRENVPGAGAKKALELLDKVSKSLPDFRRAIGEKNARTLVSLFGFTLKTAEKMVAALQGKADHIPLGEGTPLAESSSAFEEAVAGLVTLGYRETAARLAAQSAREGLRTGASPQELLRESLRHLSGRSA